MTSPTAPLLDERLAHLVTGGLSICLASRGPGNLPNLARALGCAISRDRRRLTLFLLGSQTTALLRDVRGNGELAPLGYPEPLVRTLLSFQPEDLVRITFTPQPGAIIGAALELAGQARPEALSA